MVLDEPSKDDTIFTEQGLSFMVENNLLERVKPIKIDFVDTPAGSGFVINSSLKKDKSCGSCSC
jgi:iron-sulfur cluster assembly protein